MSPVGQTVRRRRTRLPPSSPYDRDPVRRRRGAAVRIAIVGGGPAGLYFSILARRLDAANDVRVFERNAADDTFGFGVVFSDETLEAVEAADPETYADIA